jgi:hypothetical protein
MRPVQIPCRFFRQVVDSSYLCRTRIENNKIICCLFIIIYYIIVILSEGRVANRAEGSAVALQGNSFASSRISRAKMANGPQPVRESRSPQAPESPNLRGASAPDVGWSAFPARMSVSSTIRLTNPRTKICTWKPGPRRMGTCTPGSRRGRRSRPAPGNQTLSKSGGNSRYW